MLPEILQDDRSSRAALRVGQRALPDPEVRRLQPEARYSHGWAH